MGRTLSGQAEGRRQQRGASVLALATARPTASVRVARALAEVALASFFAYVTSYCRDVIAAPRTQSASLRASSTVSPFLSWMWKGEVPPKLFLRPFSPPPGEQPR